MSPIPMRYEHSRPPKIVNLFGGGGGGVGELPSCSACNGVVFNACRTPDGCLMCGCCHGQMTQLEDGQPCPGCHRGLHFRREDCSVDLPVRAQLDCVLVYCPNCQQVVCFADLRHHAVAECLFRKVRCRKCGKWTKFVNLLAHQQGDECRQYLISNLGSFESSENMSRKFRSS